VVAELALFSQGESQKIDRIVEAFAATFCRDNPGIFKEGPDSAYVLSFALIMLNTEVSFRSHQYSFHSLS
jgi:hypothetical protein